VYGGGGVDNNELDGVGADIRGKGLEEEWGGDGGLQSRRKMRSAAKV